MSGMSITILKTACTEGTTLWALYLCQLHLRGPAGSRVLSFCVLNFASTEIAPPTNHLFFDVLDKISKFNMQREWEHGENNESVPGTVQSLLRIEQQCLYTFCQRRKFERDGIVQLFCSQECKNNHDQLQQPF